MWLLAIVTRSAPAFRSGESVRRGGEMIGLRLRLASTSDRGLQIDRREVRRLEHGADGAECRGRILQQPRDAPGEVHVSGKSQRDVTGGRHRKMVFPQCGESSREQ